MSKESMTFVLWSLAIVGAATAAILYQHSVHTGIILNASVGPVSAGLNASNVISSNPVNSPGANSPATGVWAPTGPATNLGPMPYAPPQWGYGQPQVGG